MKLYTNTSGMRSPLQCCHNLANYLVVSPAGSKLRSWLFRTYSWLGFLDIYLVPEGTSASWQAINKLSDTNGVL